MIEVIHALVGVAIVTVFGSAMVGIAKGSTSPTHTSFLTAVK